jgi:hypothetical protein
MSEPQSATRPMHGFFYWFNGAWVCEVGPWATRHVLDKWLTTPGIQHSEGSLVTRFRYGVVEAIDGNKLRVLEWFEVTWDGGELHWVVGGPADDSPQELSLSSLRRRLD